jgi:predicted ATP-dependent endonuclease of OLD family
MLKSITLRFTERPEPIIVPTEGVTIFVGPNNSGKSLALREIEHALITGQIPEGKLVRDFEVSMPNADQLQADIDLLRKKAPKGLSPDQVYIGRFLPNGQLDSNTLGARDLEAQVIQNNKQWVTANFWRLFQIRLDGRTRFDLTNDRPTGDLLAIPQNILVHLFQDDELRKQVRDIIQDAFDVYFVIDPLSGGNLRIRLTVIGVLLMNLSAVTEKSSCTGANWERAGA